MENITRFVMGLLASLLGLYSILIIIRIMLTWFGHTQYSKPVQILARFTDPYLDWWRQRVGLRVGFLDLSPLVAMVALSVAQTLCSSIARQGRISLSVILVVCLSALWSAVSFLLGFCVIVLVLRLLAFLVNGNMYSPFWQVIDSISRPLLYRINRIIFGKRIPSYLTGVIASIVILAALWIGGRIAVGLLSVFLLGLPV